MADGVSYLWIQVISDDDDNNLVPENVPDPGVISPGEEELWKCDGLICPWHTTNFTNSFASFKKYSKRYVMKMSCLELFVVFFPIKYLNYVLIPKINKALEPETDISEFVCRMG